MSAKTGIEWTDRTWNPLTGCTKVSPGCDHCYAKTMHERFNGPGSFDTITLHPDRLLQPSKWRQPARVFVNSMSDLFHPDVPDQFIAQVFDAMSTARRHTFQLLTKRQARMRSFVTKYVDGWGEVPPNVWLGVSVEDQKWADIRIPALLDTPAAVRFISAEPLLGEVMLPLSWLYRESSVLPRIGWVIAGGESGRGARPIRADWVRTIRDQCKVTGTAFLFKQWGEYAPRCRLALSDGAETARCSCNGKNASHPTEMRRVGKKAAGRVLDGRTWDEYPDRPTAVLGRPT